MLWIIVSLFFCWLIFREFRSHWADRPGYDGPDPRPVSKSYLALVASLALLFAWPPFNQWRVERYLSAKARELAESPHAKVHCNTIFDTLFDREVFASGHANPATGQIVFQYPWCDRVMDYRAHPERANWEELASFHMLTHESMHVRGELNEAITECEAVQRDFRAAKLLGVREDVARRNALAYYREIYSYRGTIGGMQAAYFSAQCAPGKAMDEHLIDSTWATR
jgi:hypothetical protein